MTDLVLLLLLVTNLVLGAEQLLGFLRDVNLVGFGVRFKLLSEANIDSKKTEPALKKMGG